MSNACTTRKVERNYSMYMEVIKQSKHINEVAKKHSISGTTVRNAIMELYSKLCLKNKLKPQGWSIEIIRKDKRFEPELL